jgi:hypothetical protein
MSRLCRLLILMILILSIWLSPPRLTAANKSSQPKPVRIGHHRQLFLDDYLIEEMKSVRRNIHQADKHPGNPIITGENPWDGGRAYLYGSVERRPGSETLRMWYLSEYTPKQSGQKVAVVQCLAESTDGLKWTFPKLGLVPFDGGPTDNNIVCSTATHSGYDECLTPIRDPNPTDPARRYRSLFWASHNGYRGTYAAWSPDGVRWTAADKPAFTNTGDAGSIMYDTIRRRWIFLARPLDNQLSRAVSFSRDFETWTPLKVIFQADKRKREDYYNMIGFCYEGIYLGLVVIMWEEPGRYALEPHLVMSRDGENWSWVDKRDAFIPHGPRGSWEEFNTQTGAGEPVRIGGKLHFYYSGRSYPHRPYYAQSNPKIIPKQLVESDVNIGLATLRVDGFASLEDYWGGGTVQTKPLLFDGSRLHANVASEHGQLRVEVLDRSGQPIPGFTLADSVPSHADSVDQTIRWKKHDSLKSLAGQTIRLKFHLKKAKLYSFWID